MILREKKVEPTYQPPRPFSEILMPPSIIEFKASQPLKLLKLSTGDASDEKNTKNVFQIAAAANDSCENVDGPSVEFENALERSIDLSPHNSRDENRSNINCTNGSDTLNVQQPGGFAASSVNGSNSNDLFCKQGLRVAEDIDQSENRSEQDLSAEQLMYNDVYSIRKQIDADIDDIDSIVDNLELVSKEAETKTNSEASSAIDTGFNSLGDSQFSVDVAEVYFEESSMRKIGNSRLSVTKGIPTPLRSCYMNTYEINSDHGNTSRDYSSFSRTSGSSMSASISEDDNMSGFLSLDNSLHSPNGSNPVSSPMATSSKRGDLAETYKTSAQLNLKTFEKNSDAVKKKKQTNKSKNARQVDVVSKELSYIEKIKISTKEWKDDYDVPRIINNASDDVTKDYRSRGTWPRHANRSKKKRNQAEADELLRKFRETSEIYRARFREIYAETRRKIEETMFGLRVAVAKSGYSSKYYSADKVNNPT